MPDPLARNPVLLCLIRAMQMSLFPMAILSVFLQREIGFGVADIMLLQAVFGVAMVVFEFPSGYLADRIGYRRCLILAFALWSVAWPIYGQAQGWLGVASAELLLGIGMALISGCDTALLYESLLAKQREENSSAFRRSAETHSQKSLRDFREHADTGFMKWAGRLTFSGQIAEGTAALVAGLLFATATSLPFWAQGGASAIGLALAFALVEPERERPGFTDSLVQIRAMVRHVARENPELRAVFAAAVVLGLASFVPVWTIQLYALDAGVPEPWMGPLWAVANFTVAIAALLSHRVFGSRPLWLVVGLSAALIFAGYLGLGLHHGLWGFAFYYLLTIMRGLQNPALAHREQQLVPSSDRAGFVSLRSMVFRLGFLAVGPAIGWAVDHHGQHPVMLALAAGFTLASLLTMLLLPRARPWPADGPRSASG
jgi:MFS family permease